jgi:uncharacterized protein involved in outer membrane biogenesis
MRLRKVFFWSFLALFTAIVLALAWLWTADLGIFKPQIERLVTEKTGREFAIEGELLIDFQRHATVVAEDIRLANADWAEEPEMVTVGRLEVRVDLWSLIRGPILVELIDIDDASIRLSNPEDQEPNWILPIETAPREEVVDAPGLDIMFKLVDIDRVSVILESAERTRPLHFEVERLDQRHRDDEFLDLELRATLNDRTVNVDGEVGTWDELLAGRDFEFDIDAVLDTFQFSAKGHIDDLVDLRRPTIEFTAAGPDIDDLTQLLGLGDDGEGDISLSGALVPYTDGALTLDVSGNFGMTEIEASGAVADLRSLDQVALKVYANGPDVSRLLRIAGIHQLRETPFMVRIDAETSQGRFVVREARAVFADSRIDASAEFPNFPSVDDAVIKVQIEGPDIERFRYVTGLPGAATGAFSLDFQADVAEDGVEILELLVRTSLGEVRADGRLGDPETFLGTRLNFSVASDSLARLAGAYGLDGMPDEAVDISGTAEYGEEGVRTIGPVSATIDEISAKVDGLLRLTPGIVGTEFTFDGGGPDLAELVGYFAETDFVPALPYHATGSMEFRDDGFRFRNIRGSLGSSNVQGEGFLVPREWIPGSWFTVQVDGEEYEEIIESILDIDVRPGPYELTGRIDFSAEAITLTDIVVDRKEAGGRLNLGIGMPASRQWLDFDAQVRGPDIRDLVPAVGDFELLPQPVRINVRGKRRGSQFSFDEWQFSVGDATSQASGEFELEDAMTRTEFDFMVNVPNLASLGTWNGHALSEQALSIHAHVTTGDGVVEFEQLQARIGESDVNGYVRLEEGDVPELKVNVYSEELVYKPFVVEPEEYEYEAEPEFEDGRLIPDIPMPFEAMRGLNASVDVDIGLLERGKLLLEDIELIATLQDGVLDISKAALKARSGALSSRARLDPADGAGAASIQLVARQLAFGISEQNVDLAMRGDLDINLRSTGTDLRALLGNANGEFFMDTRGGRVTNNRFIQAIYGDLLQEILTTINPFRQTDPYTDFRCIVVPLKFDDGKVTSAPNGFINTSKVRMAATTSLDLKSEKLQVAVRTTPERALSISAGELINPYVQVVGTLARPRLAVDETGLLITGGAAVATGGLTILARGIWDRLARSRNPCEDTSARAREELADRFPDIVIESFERIQ